MLAKWKWHWVSGGWIAGVVAILGLVFYGFRMLPEPNCFVIYDNGEIRLLQLFDPRSDGVIQAVTTDRQTHLYYGNEKTKRVIGQGEVTHVEVDEEALKFRYQGEECRLSAIPMGKARRLAW